MELVEDYKHMVSVGASNHGPASQSPSFDVQDNLFAVNGSRVTSTNGNVNVADNGRQCNVCQQTFQRRADLQVHIERVHQGTVVKPHKCQTCGKSFANASYLAQHSRIHLGLKPYHCQVCDRRFTQLSHQQQHMRTHTGERPYACRQSGCNKSFSQLSNLQSHMRSHMTDRPFRCHSCYKCFSDEAALREHIPHHNETKHLKTKICTVCGKSYAQDTYLARHMARHQPITVSGGAAAAATAAATALSNGGAHGSEAGHCTNNIANMVALHQSMPTYDTQLDNGFQQLPLYRLIGDVHQSMCQPMQSNSNTFSGLFGMSYGNDRHL